MGWMQAATIARRQLPHKLCLVMSSFFFLYTLPILLSFSLFFYDRSTEPGPGTHGLVADGREVGVKEEACGLKTNGFAFGFTRRHEYERGRRQ